jgi:hypothetical protein
MNIAFWQGKDSVSKVSSCRAHRYGRYIAAGCTKGDGTQDMLRVVAGKRVKSPRVTSPLALPKLDSFVAAWKTTQGCPVVKKAARQRRRLGAERPELPTVKPFLMETLKEAPRNLGIEVSGPLPVRRERETIPVGGVAANGKEGAAFDARHRAASSAG